jgi:hypothetical protein
MPTSSSFVAPPPSAFAPAIRRTRSASSLSWSSSPTSLSAASRGQQRQTQEQQRRSTEYNYPASKVTDPHGPTPNIEPDPFPEIDIDTHPEMHYDPNNHPVAHQPWRRGDTDGCHDVITSKWRLEAEDVIVDAIDMVGGKVVDVTWYIIILSTLAITNALSTTSLSNSLYCHHHHLDDLLISIIIFFIIIIAIDIFQMISSFGGRIIHPFFSHSFPKRLLPPSHESSQTLCTDTNHGKVRRLWSRKYGQEATQGTRSRWL